MPYMVPVLPFSTKEGQIIGEQRHKKLPSSIKSDRKSLRQFTIPVQPIIYTIIAGGAI